MVCLGSEDDDYVLGRDLAMGAALAFRLEDGHTGWRDPALTARTLAGLIKELGPDLVLTGVQSADSGEGQIGVRLAARLNLPHASVIIGLEEVGEIIWSCAGNWRVARRKKWRSIFRPY